MHRALIVGWVILLTACATTTQPLVSPTAGTTPAPTDTATRPPTLTRAPTFTPTATATSTPTATATPPRTFTPTPLPASRIKAMSFNLLYGAGVERQWDSALPSELVGKNRLPEIISVIRQANPDIWGIQEANGWDRGTPPTIQQVAQQLGMNFAFAKTPGGFHLGLITKFEILETADLSTEIGRQGALRVTLLAPDGQRLNVFVVHLNPNSSDARLCQVNLLLDHMQPYTRQRTLLLGDMNFKPTSREYARLEQAGWKSVATEPSWGIDQIWFFPSTTWERTAWFDSLRIPDGLSDHKPVGAEIKISALPTLAPTLTPTSTPPPPPLPDVVTRALPDAQVLRWNKFEDPCAFSRWNTFGSAEKISNGALELLGIESWQASAARYREFSAGQGVWLRFQFAPESEFTIHFDNSAWNTDQYRRFGIAVRNKTVNALTWEGKDRVRREILPDNFELQSGTVYNLLLALGKNGELGAQVWDPAHPTRVLKFHEHMGASWTDVAWRFSVAANRGRLWLDDVVELAFREIH